MDMYETICQKLGVDLDSYQFHEPETEDDNDYDNLPFNKLTIEELDFLIERQFEKKGIKHAE